MNDSLVSVIVPIYKVEKFLRNCIDSIISQTYKNLEIILVDDGSPDNCPSICNEYAEKDTRIHVIHKVNGGLSDARNSGIKNSNGEYLIFLDSDDMLFSNDVIFNLIKFLKTQKSTITYCTYVQRFSTENEIISPIKTCDTKNSVTLTHNQLFDFTKKKQLIFAAWLFIVKRDFIIQNNLFFKDNLLHEDMEWIPRLICADKENKINIFSRPYYLYRYNPESITGVFNQKRFDSLCEILITTKKLLINTNEKQFLKKWFNMILYNLFLYFENEYYCKSPLYNDNIKYLKTIILNNIKYLNLRNFLIFNLMIIQPNIFYKMRNKIIGLKNV